MNTGMLERWRAWPYDRDASDCLAWISMENWFLYWNWLPQQTNIRMNDEGGELELGEWWSGQY